VNVLIPNNKSRGRKIFRGRGRKIFRGRGRGRKIFRGRGRKIFRGRGRKIFRGRGRGRKFLGVGVGVLRLGLNFNKRRGTFRHRGTFSWNISRSVEHFGVPTSFF
jgi:hypothetical protein